MPASKPLRAGDLRIRMYRVGFGDCFLVSIPKPAGHAHILVDCGVHPQGNLATLGDVVKDIEVETKGRLDIVIATHAHQDHISGFGTHASTFSGMSVGEVWLPWTENSADRQALRLRKKQIALIDALTQHFAVRPAGPEIQYVMQNLASNATAMQLLKTGINSGTVRYLEAGKDIDHGLDAPGFSVRVLGPPRDERFLARMDPPAGDRYLRAAAGDLVAANAVRPFVEWIKPKAELPPTLRLSAALERALREETRRLYGLAFSLDQAVNNSSVVVVFSVAGQHLLFPGDAQYGNWAAWLGGTDAADILSRLTFFKVAHHGSHNATPRQALEGLTDGQVAAMVSTQIKPWPSIPRKPLIDALDKKTKKRWVRSDSIALKGAPNVVPQPLKRGFSRGQFWYDYTTAL